MSKRTKIAISAVFVICMLIIGVIILQRPVEEEPPVSQPASFEVSNLVLNSTMVEVDQAIDISVTVKNVGDLEGSYTAILRIDGALESSQSVTLAGKGTKVIHFTVTRTTSKNYTASVEKLVQSFQVIPSEPEMIVFQGIGQNTTETFTLEKGISIFQMYHYGNSNFTIWLCNAGTGKRVDLLVNEVGIYIGSKFVGVTGEPMQVSPGEYLLEVAADGEWQVTIEQPRAFQASELPQTLIGAGDFVLPPFTLEQGTVKFEFSYDGNSNFAVWLCDNDGNLVNQLVNEIGAFEGSKTVEVTGAPGQASPGIYYLAIISDGNVRVVITPV